jgi:hypothetical protein
MHKDLEVLNYILCLLSCVLLRIDLFCNYFISSVFVIVVIFCCNLSFCCIFGTSKILSLTLIDWLFTFRSRIFHLHGDITIAGEGLQNLGQCSALRAFEQGGRDLYRATTAVTRDLVFSGLIRRTAPFCRLLRHSRGCGGSTTKGSILRQLCLCIHTCAAVVAFLRQSML